jgi:hypothetical protein
MKGYVRYITKQYRKAMTPHERKASLREASKPRDIQYPYKQEKAIQGKIKNIYESYSKTLVSFIKAHYPRKFAYDSRMDDFSTEFELFLRKIDKDYTAAAIGSKIFVDLGPYLRKISEFILTFDEKEVADYMQEISGVSFYGTIDWWKEVQDAWVGNSVTRAAETVSTFYDNMHRSVLDAVKKGMDFDDVVKMIQDMDSSLTDARAAFLARDLTGKLNGIITQKLQTGLGLQEYFWQTAADERVRGRPGGKYPNALPSHWAMDSVICSWADPNICSFDYGITWVPRLANMPHYHPGMDWQCRCRGTPFSLELLRTLDKEIAREETGGII